MNHSIVCATRAYKTALWILSLLGTPMKMQARKDHSPGTCILDMNAIHADVRAV